MPTVALDLNDAALTLAAGGRVLASEPGLAAPPGSFGAGVWHTTALVSSRHWRDLDDAPLPCALGPWRSHADIVQAQLASLVAALPPDCEALVATVPSYWSERQLGLFLGLARDAGLPLRGLVDQATAAARRPAPGRGLWQLELTLHDAALVRILQQDGVAGRGAVERFDWLSLQALERACIDAVADAFLRSSRFDPRHDAPSERELRRRLPGWLEALHARERLSCAIEYRGGRFHAELDAGSLRMALALPVERLVQRLRPLAPAAGAVLQVPERLAAFPGMLDALRALPGWEIATLEPGAAALGALRLPPAAAGAPLALVMRLPWDGPALEPLVGPVAKLPPPTHLCFGERAFRLDAGGFCIGSELAEGEYGLRLAASLRGLSRRHCSLVVEDGQLLLHDHSRYGTHLNGVRVEGAAVLRAGDRIQLGEPAVELRLVIEEGRDGSAP